MSQRNFYSVESQDCELYLKSYIFCLHFKFLTYIFMFGYGSNTDPHPQHWPHRCVWVGISVVDPDPYWIRIQELPGSGSVFGIRIQIGIHTCKYKLKWRQKM